MRRGKSGSAVREAVSRLRDEIPGLTLRTSLIVGFPGETAADFEELLNFVEETRFERLGVFKYSEEEGTAAASFPGKVSEEEKEARWQEVMDLQSRISRANNEALIGTEHQVMIEAVDPDTQQFYGRTQAHAPEVDGIVYVRFPRDGGFSKPSPGEIVTVKIVEAEDYDLTSEILYG
jgi:ribosomal protein S12 methylthiotransferase